MCLMEKSIEIFGSFFLYLSDELFSFSFLTKMLVDKMLIFHTLGNKKAVTFVIFRPLRLVLFYVLVR